MIKRMVKSVLKVVRKIWELRGHVSASLVFLAVGWGAWKLALWVYQTWPSRVFWYGPFPPEGR